MNNDDIKRAKKAYAQAIDEDDNFILPVRALAWMYFEEKEYETALGYFKKALEINPYEQSMDNGAAICYRALGKLEEAEKHYKANLEKFPQHI